MLYDPTTQGRFYKALPWVKASFLTIFFYRPWLPIMALGIWAIIFGRTHPGWGEWLINNMFVIMLWALGILVCLAILAQIFVSIIDCTRETYKELVREQQLFRDSKENGL